ncbi:MAG TPA: TetR/AcrR family transcriptional regulator [Propionicimonas sp.]|jgi:AcrR family transcriptional regulator|nr:TetR/AcrR family transcriptional regulator [Propionicimonas sp.]
MPRISDDRRADRQRQIADAALRCFRRRGFENTSMADIITETGMSAGAIYVHFESKQELVRRVISEVFAARGAELADLADRDPLPAPKQVVREFADRIADASDAELRLYAWATSLHDAELGGLMARHAATRQRLYRAYFLVWLQRVGLDEATAALRCDGLAELLVGICQGLVVQYALVPDFDPERYLAALDWVAAAKAGAA